jgi:lysylphosphatidylglycerol synthetase-like protein (DUF2156 family)
MTLTAIQHRKLEDIKRFGHHCTAYSTIEDDINEFRHPSFEGFVGYMILWGTCYVLSNPITARQDYKQATELFLEKFPKALFCQINQEYADLLNSLGLYVHNFGVEHHTDLNQFKISWSIRRGLKRASKLSGLGFYLSEDTPDPGEIDKISRQWLRNKQRGIFKPRDLRFLGRAFDFQKDRKIGEVRIFFLNRGHKTYGFCTLDPMYSEDQSRRINGYVVQHWRVSNDAPKGASDFLISQSFLTLKEDGFKHASLGLSPLHDRNNNNPFRNFILVNKIFDMMYLTNFLYRFKTIAEFKDHYRATKTPIYLAARQRLPLRALIGLLKINNLI